MIYNNYEKEKNCQNTEKDENNHKGCYISQQNCRGKKIKFKYEKLKL